MRRVAVIFLTQFLLWVIVSQLNHALSGLHLYVFAGGLYVTYAALTLELRHGLLVSFLGGLLCDANLPLAPDLPRLALALAHPHALLFVCAYAVIFQMRGRLPRTETVARVLIALFANLALFLVISFVQASHTSSVTAVWRRVVVDLVVSQIFLALVAPWFFSLQTAALLQARIGRENLDESP